MTITLLGHIFWGVIWYGSTDLPWFSLWFIFCHMHMRLGLFLVEPIEVESVAAGRRLWFVPCREEGPGSPTAGQ